MAKKDPRLKELAEMVKDYLVEENINAEQYSEQFINILGNKLTTLTDCRQQVKVKHLMYDCVGIVLFASFAGIDEWKEMEIFAKENIAMLSGYLKLPNGIPSHDTLERVFSIINPSELQGLLVEVLRESIERACGDNNVYENKDLDIFIKDVVAFDGKETRNTGDKYKEKIEDQRNFNVLNVQSTETGITLSTTKIDEKTNEIPETQRILKSLDLKGCVVTADALNTQKETAKAIITLSHGDYCLAVKNNQKRLYSDLVLYFQDTYVTDNLKKKDNCYLKETEETARKIITWEHYITDDVDWFENKDDWQSLKSFGYLRKSIYDKNTDTEVVEERYYICSFKPVADLFALVIRRHWHVECLHWMLDIVFKEDKLHTKNKNALHNLGLINRFVLSILKILKPYYNNLSFRYIRRKIGRNPLKEMPVVFVVIKKLYEIGELPEL